MDSIVFKLVLLGVPFVLTNSFLIALTTIHTQHQITFQSKIYRTFLALITILNISAILYLTIATDIKLDLGFISVIILHLIHYGGCLRVIENQINRTK